MLQEQETVGPREEVDVGAYMTAQGLATMLALAGSKRLGTEELRRKMKLNSVGFADLLKRLQRDYLVDLVSGLEGYEVKESVVLTDKGERVLLGLLERMCELPELR